ncbi:MAG: hypothetical protein ACRBBQ_00265 [Cognatishimia sp.]
MIGSFLLFRLYFRWCSFEPVLPDLYPDRGFVLFETITCTLLYALHIFFYAAENAELANAFYWVCVGNIVSAGIFPPVASYGENEGFLQRIANNFWKAKFGGIIVTTMIAIYLFFFSWAVLPGKTTHNTALLGALSLCGLITTFKATAALGMKEHILDGFKAIQFRGKLSAVISLGFVGQIGVIALLLISRSASSTEVNLLQDEILIGSVFLGTLLRI